MALEPTISAVAATGDVVSYLEMCQQEGASQLHDSRHRHREVAVRATNPSGSDSDRTRTDAVDLERMQCRCDSDHVGNGVERAYLMEVHALWWQVMNSSLGVG